MVPVSHGRAGMSRGEVHRGCHGACTEHGVCRLGWHGLCVGHGVRRRVWHAACSGAWAMPARLARGVLMLARRAGVSRGARAAAQGAPAGRRKSVKETVLPGRPTCTPCTSPLSVKPPQAAGPAHQRTPRASLTGILHARVGKRHATPAGTHHAWAATVPTQPAYPMHHASTAPSPTP